MKNASPMITKKPPTPMPFVHAAAGDADQHHQAEADAHQDDAGAAVAPGRAVPRALVDEHGAIEAARVDFRRRHQASFDHRDPLADFELAHARLAQRQRR